MTNDEIKAFIASRIAEGISLSRIQDALLAEKQVKMTFMELRMLASEIESAQWEKLDKPEAAPAKDLATAPADPAGAPAEEALPEEESSPLPPEESASPAAEEKLRGKTVVEMGKIAMPGAVANGTVKFGSGPTAEWYLDQAGRLGLDKLEGGKPDEQDIREFQVELRKVLGM